MFAGAPKPTIIRKVTTVPAQPKPKPKSSSQPPKPVQTSSQGVSKRTSNATASKSNASHGRAEEIKNERNGHLTPPPLSASKRSNKRKAPSPSLVPEFDDSSEEESEISHATPPVQKRVRHDTLEPDPKRQLRPVDTGDRETQNDKSADRIIHGADLTWEKPKEFKSAFALGDGEEIPILGLQYPSRYAPER